MTAVNALLEHLRATLTHPEDLKRAEDLLEIVSVGTDEMRQHILELVRARFGRSSEKKSRAELGELLQNGGPGIPEEVAAQYRALNPTDAAKNDSNGCEKAASKNIAPKTRKRSGRNSSIPADFPRVEEVIDVGADEKICTDCGGSKYNIGRDTTEQLHYVPARLEIRRNIYPKYACPKCPLQKIVCAPRRERPTIGDGLATFSLLAHIVVSKYVDHLPLYRLHRMFARQGLPLPESTMGKWVADCADAIEPIAKRIEKKALEAHVLQTDDTGLQVLDADHINGSKRGHLWGYLGDKKWFCYRYTPNWQAADAQEFLKKRQGWLVADAYKGYDAIFSAPDSRCIEVGCWSHTRRYFEKALAQDKQAAVGLHFIGALYALEATATENQVSDNQRQQLRQEHAIPILTSFRIWIDEHKPLTAPKSALGKSLSYIDNQWEALQRFLRDGALPLDTTAIERAHRATAVGRKNWLFAGSDAAAHRAAILYTIAGTCALNKVNASTYIADVLMRIQQRGTAARIDELLPSNWVAHQ